MRQMCSRAVVMAMLAWCCAQDIKRKKINLAVILAFAILGIALRLAWNNASAVYLLSGMAPGAALLLLSWLTGGQVGAGDGALLMATGIYLGLEQNLAMFFAALAICAICALALLIFRKKSGKDTLPFVPFMLAGYIATLAGGR